MLIFGTDFSEKILKADTKKKADRLALEIQAECEKWKDIKYKDGHKDGQEELRRAERTIEREGRY